MVVGPLAVNDLRSKVVAFTTPFYQDYTGVLFKLPDSELYKWKTYFRPFSWQVMVCLFCLSLSVCLFLPLPLFVPPSLCVSVCLCLCL